MKKNKKPIIVLHLLILASQPLLAETNADTIISGEMKNNIALIAIISTIVLLFIVALVLLKAFNTISKYLIKIEETEEVKQGEYILKPSKTKLTFWQKILSLRPMSEEKDLEIDHEYDGIKELDNPTPGWFNFLFYSSIIFGIVYFLNYHVFKTGKLQDQEYIAEMEQAEVDKAKYLASVGNIIDENNVTINLDASVLASGQALYVQNCVACHGANGEGLVGPNLTDEFWLHGGSIGDVFKSIKYGIPDKGMISWEKQLSPQQISDVSNYIESLQGTNPPNAKEAQGEKYVKDADDSVVEKEKESIAEKI
jgi:cytochrome c oxidase cbb3-type subunit 3